MGKSYPSVIGFIFKSILIAALFILNNDVFAQAPTVPSTSFSSNYIDGNHFYVSFTKGDGARRIIIASTNPVTAVPLDGADYIANTTMGLGNELKPGEFVIYNGTGSASYIYGLNHSTTYYFRVYEFDGTDYTTEYLTTEFLEGNGTTLSGPTIQASNLTFTNITGSGMTVGWTNGNGSSRILIAREDGAVNVEPQDLTNYNSNSNYGTYQIGTGNYVVYMGGGSSRAVTNLKPNTTYHYSIFEYNGSSGKIYLRPGSTGSYTTASAPTVAATNSVFYQPYTDVDRLYHYFTRGNGEKRIVIAKKGSPVTAVPEDGQDYNFSNTFGSGFEIGPDEFVVYNGTGAENWLYSLDHSSLYYIKVFEYNGSGANTFYLTETFLEGNGTTLSSPTVQASNLTFSNVTGSGMTVNWTNGNGSARILIAREGGAVDVEPQDLTNYNSNSNYGTYQIGTGNYVVYMGGGSSRSVTNLKPNTTYHYAIFEYNGSNKKLYLRPGSTGSYTTASAPTVAATNSVFYQPYTDVDRLYHYFTRGNGEKRIVIAKKGSPVTAVPEDGQDYNFSNTFGSGFEIAPDEFVVYNGTGAENWLYNLDHSSLYYIKVFEYNGSGANTFYLTETFLEGSGTTLSSPTVQASNLTFSNVTGSGMTVNWTNGNGSARILIAREGGAVDVEPQDLTNYNSNSNYGTYQIGTGNYVVYMGGGSSRAVTNLKPNTSYHYAIFEYNGSNKKLYLRPGSTGSYTTASAPTVAATNSVFYHPYTDVDRLYHYFTRGNGEKRIVIAKKGSPVTAVPEDGQDYNFSNTFGSGFEIGPDEFVVYNGTGAENWLYNLDHSSLYYIKVFEYNGSGANTFFLTETFLEGSQSTLSHPTVQSSNAFLSSRSTTSLNVSWTKGNGTYRLLVGRKDGPVNVEPQDLSNYSASTSFGSRQIGTTGNYVLYGGTGNNVNITNLEAGTNYHFALFEYNGSSGKLYLRPGYAFALETFGERPTVQVSGAQFTNIDFSSFDVNMTAGNGSRRLVLAREGGPVSSGPADFVSYAANTSFGEGAQIGSDNFVVYNDFGEDFSMSNLDPGKNYHFAFYEYSMSSSGELYMSPPFTASQTTLGAPTQIATNFAATGSCTTQPTLSWTAGNGAGRLVVISQEELNTLPVNYSNYSANPAYGSGAILGNGFVVYNGSGENITINSLQEFSNFQVNIFEYNGTAESPYFNTTALKGSLGDITPPTIEAVGDKTITGNLECAALLPDYTGEAVVADNCDVAPVVTQLPESGSIISGTTTVTLFVTDDFGNTEETSFDVVVLDETAPEISAPEPITITEAESADYQLAQPVATDNCEVLSIIPFVNNLEIDLNTYIFVLGVTEVSWVVKDAAGNEASVTQLVEVIPGCSTTLTSVDTYPLNVFVSPEQGSSATEFIFKVLYSDVSGAMPAAGYPKVELDANGDGDALDPLDLNFVMEEDNIADTDVTDGKIYTMTVSGLSPLNWKSRVVSENSEGCRVNTNFEAKPFVSDNLLDLAIYASDISFSRDNPAIGEPINIYARIKNPSDFSAENFVVSIYAEDELLSTQTVSQIPAQGSITLEWEQSFSTSDFVPIKVVIDETNVLDEINELNNFAIRPIIVGDFVLPGGIEITASLTPIKIEPNKPIRISGNALYYGIDEGVDPDVAGATIKAAIAGGNSGQTYTRSDGTFEIILTVPNTPGIYTVNGDITDYTLSANFGPLTFEVIQPAPLPDLISSISLDKISMLQGEEVSGVATVTNRGNQTAENFVFKYYNCEMIIGEEAIASLAPGASLQFPFTVTVNSVTDCLNPNNCPFIASADSGFHVVESSENNNASQRSLTVLPGKPDLTPQLTVIGTYYKMAEPVSLNVKVNNVGGITSGAFAVNVYSDGTLIHTENVSELSNCSNTTFNVNYTFPDLNDHVITVLVDEAGMIDEFRETNNSYSKTVKNLVIITEPNLHIAVSDLSVLPVLPGEGESFQISANFRNNGTAALTSPFDVKFTITEAGIDRSETIRIEENMAVNQVLNRNILTNLSAYGNHSVQVQLDPANEVTEKSKSDNTTTAPLCLDFRPSIVGQVWNGGFYRDTEQQLTIRLQNLGLFTAENVSVRFYLDDIEIAATTVPIVGPYGKNLSNVPVSIPYIFDEDGIFELSVKVDDPGLYTECNEDNNSFSKSIVVKPPMPDLRVISEYISPTELNPDIDEPINIFLSFDNVGIMRSDAFIARVAVDDVQLGQDVSVPALNPGENGTIAIAAPYSSATGGIRIIRGFVDADNLIVESNETNNEASRAIIIGDAPNLFITELDIDLNCPEDGEEVSITASIENEGDLGTDAEVQFYYIAGTDTIPIDRKNINIDANAVVTTAINWTVVNREYSIYAEIENSSQPEFDVLDNSLRSEFCTAVMYAVKVEAIGQGIVRKNPDQSKYEVGTQLEIKAVPAQGWFFKNWAGATTGNINPLDLTVDGDKEITAVFEQIPVNDFAVVVDVQGNGFVTKTPEKDTYSLNEEVSLEAIAAEGFVFIEWLGDILSSSPLATLTMDSNKSITAVFVEDLNIDYVVTNSSCTGLADGKIELAVTGGSIPYSYDWDNDGIGEEDAVPDSKDLDNIPAGIFSVQVTDANGLTKTVIAEVLAEETGTTFYADLDDDGLGDPGNSIVTCIQPEHYVTDNTDCDDSDAGILGVRNWYNDNDLDGFGDKNETILSCTQPEGYVANNDDCDDFIPEVGPALAWFADGDGDGFGDINSEPIYGCSAPSTGYVNNNEDCNDEVDTINPEAIEIPGDGIDQNCDGVDETALSITAPEDVYSLSCSGAAVLGEPVLTGHSSSAVVTNDAPDSYVQGSNIITWTVVDGDQTDTAEQLVIVKNTVPVVNSITAPEDPQPVTQEIFLAASYNDDNISSVTFNWGDGTTAQGTFADGIANGSHFYTLPGVYTITVTLADDCGTTASLDFNYLVIYDPNAGFVTGRGEIWSPQGAYTTNPALEGVASFGFVSKYKKGASVPDGRTQFEFLLGNFNFESISYEWLTVAGTKAMFKGNGMVNGLPGYGFLISAIDNDETGDRFRIKIWETGSELVIYDNQLGADNNADASTGLLKGSIKINGNKGNKGNKAQEEPAIQLSEVEPAVEILETLAVAPNPMSTDAVARFSLKEDAEVILRVFDFNGREIIVLYTGSVRALDIYDIPIQRNNMMSGVYILKLTTASGYSYDKQFIVE